MVTLDSIHRRTAAAVDAFTQFNVQQTNLHFNDAAYTKKSYIPLYCPCIPSVIDQGVQLSGDFFHLFKPDIYSDSTLFSSEAEQCCPSNRDMTSYECTATWKDQT